MEKLNPGDLVYLTGAYEKYMYEKHPNLKISLVNRLAKLEEIIDWESEKGEKIKKAREMSGKWDDLPLEESKYILSIFYPDFRGRKGELGVIERGVSIFKNHPETGYSLFEKLPDWMYREIKKKCESFDVELKESNDYVS